MQLKIGDRVWCCAPAYGLASMGTVSWINHDRRLQVRVQVDDPPHPEDGEFWWLCPAIGEVQKASAIDALAGVLKGGA